MTNEELTSAFGQSEAGNFWIVDTIGVPHPYCITPRHVRVAADQYGGMLGVDAVESAERQGARCGVRGCQLRYDQHEKALLVECRIEMKGADGLVVPELHAWLLSCKERATAGGYAGFAFKRA